MFERAMDGESLLQRIHVMLIAYNVSRVAEVAVA